MISSLIAHIENETQKLTNEHYDKFEKILMKNIKDRIIKGKSYTVIQSEAIVYNMNLKIDNCQIPMELGKKLAEEWSIKFQKKVKNSGDTCRIDIDDICNLFDCYCQEKTVNYNDTNINGICGKIENGQSCIRLNKNNVKRVGMRINF